MMPTQTMKKRAHNGDTKQRHQFTVSVGDATKNTSPNNNSHSHQPTKVASLRGTFTPSLQTILTPSTSSNSHMLEVAAASKKDVHRIIFQKIKSVIRETVVDSLTTSIRCLSLDRLELPCLGGMFRDIYQDEMAQKLHRHFDFDEDLRPTITSKAEEEMSEELPISEVSKWFSLFPSATSASKLSVGPLQKRRLEVGVSIPLIDLSSVFCFPEDLESASIVTTSMDHIGSHGTASVPSNPFFDFVSAHQDPTEKFETHCKNAKFGFKSMYPFSVATQPHCPFTNILDLIEFIVTEEISRESNDILNEVADNLTFELRQLQSSRFTQSSDDTLPQSSDEYRIALINFLISEGDPQNACKQNFRFHIAFFFTVRGISLAKSVVHPRRLRRFITRLSEPRVAADKNVDNKRGDTVSIPIGSGGREAFCGFICAPVHESLECLSLCGIQGLNDQNLRSLRCHQHFGDDDNETDEFVIDDTSTSHYYYEEATDVFSLSVESPCTSNGISSGIATSAASSSQKTSFDPHATPTRVTGGSDRSISSVSRTPVLTLKKDSPLEPSQTKTFSTLSAAAKEFAPKSLTCSGQTATPHETRAPALLFSTPETVTESQLPSSTLSGISQLIIGGVGTSISRAGLKSMLTPWPCGLTLLEVADTKQNSEPKGSLCIYGLETALRVLARELEANALELGIVVADAIRTDAVRNTCGKGESLSREQIALKCIPFSLTTLRLPKTGMSSFSLRSLLNSLQNVSDSLELVGMAASTELIHTQPQDQLQSHLHRAHSSSSYTLSAVSDIHISLPLKHLNIAGNLVGYAGIIELSRFVQNCPNLVSLDISNCGVGNKEPGIGCNHGDTTRDVCAHTVMASLFESLSTRTQLRILNLSGNRIGSTCIRSVKRDFSKGLHSENSDVSVRPANPPSLGVISLCNLLCSSATLQTLDISTTGLNIHDATSIINSIHHSSSLRHLSMDSNLLSTAGGGATLTSTSTTAPMSSDKLDSLEPDRLVVSQQGCCTLCLVASRPAQQVATASGFYGEVTFSQPPSAAVKALADLLSQPMVAPVSCGLETLSLDRCGLGTSDFVALFESLSPVSKSFLDANTENLSDFTQGSSSQTFTGIIGDNGRLKHEIASPFFSSIIAQSPPAISKPTKETISPLANLSPPSYTHGHTRDDCPVSQARNCRNFGTYGTKTQFKKDTEVQTAQLTVAFDYGALMMKTNKASKLTALSLTLNHAGNRCTQALVDLIESNETLVSLNLAGSGLQHPDAIADICLAMERSNRTLLRLKGLGSAAVQLARCEDRNAAYQESIKGRTYVRQWREGWTPTGGNTKEDSTAMDYASLKRPFNSTNK